MSRRTETIAVLPEPKGTAGTPQNLPTTESVTASAAAPHQLPSDLTVAHGRVLTAATASQAAALGLAVRAEARWPESAHDDTAPALAGFIVSSFSPVAAETAARCLRGYAAAEGLVTAVVIATARGDRESAAHVARTVAEGGLLGPLLFFQSVPNAVAGHIAARWNLTGPVVCLADPVSALEAAAQLIEDGDADEALLVGIEQAAEGQDQAHAVLLRATGTEGVPEAEAEAEAVPAPHRPTAPGAHP